MAAPKWIPGTLRRELRLRAPPQAAASFRAVRRCSGAWRSGWSPGSHEAGRQRAIREPLLRLRGLRGLAEGERRVGGQRWVARQRRGGKRLARLQRWGRAHEAASSSRAEATFPPAAPPRSPSLTWLASVTKTLAGLMSRCITRFSCMYASASAARANGVWVALSLPCWTMGEKAGSRHRVTRQGGQYGVCARRWDCAPICEKVLQTTASVSGCSAFAAALMRPARSPCAAWQGERRSAARSRVCAAAVWAQEAGRAATSSITTVSSLCSITQSR